MAMPLEKVDRQSTTPFLLKLFYREGAFPSLSNFSTSTSPHLEIYTWANCTLRELTHQLIASQPTLFPTPAIGTRLSFRLIFPDTRSIIPSSTGPGRYLSRDLGSVIVGDENPAILDSEKVAAPRNGPLAGRATGQPELMLRDGKFVTGDYISVAILPPLASGEVAPPLKGEDLDVRSAGRGRSKDWPDSRDLQPERGNGFRGRGRGISGYQNGGFGRDGLPKNGEWRRGEAVPAGPTVGARRGGFGGGRVRDRW